MVVGLQSALPGIDPEFVERGKGIAIMFMTPVPHSHRFINMHHTYKNPTQFRQIKCIKNITFKHIYMRANKNFQTTV